MYKKLTGMLFLVMIAVIPLWLFFTGGFWEILFPEQKKLEEAFAEHFPANAFWDRLRTGLNYIGGSKEQNGVFIAEDMLMLNVQTAGQDVIDSNATQVIELSLRFERPVYLMLIPTASGIQQSKVPYNNFAPLYDQRALIDRIYRRMAGNLTVIDVYPALFNHQSEYIYYRTDNAPTGMGGYYIYTTAAKKLGLPQVRGIDQFDVEHIDFNYYGDLYDLAPYNAVPADRVSLYHFARGRRGYIMTHHDNRDSIRRYYTLYPEYRQQLGDSMDVVLGGVSPIIDIQVENSQYNRQLLIFGDHTVQSYLPFLLVHYSRVTFVETAQVAPELLTKLNPWDYSQNLFAYSVDRFVSGEQLAALSRFAAPTAVQKG
ncbi:MAG: hypothetical protein HFG19_03795 [Oscillospiraceae bacterium]|nr:hypothetical protein [Oscillospiraceae bacterium]